MATFQIFEHQAGDKTFAVWVTDGLVQYVIDGQIQHDIETVNDFLLAAAKEINAGNDTANRGFEVRGSGQITEESLENFDGGDGPVFDAGGGGPHITLQDGDTRVNFGGSGIGGSFSIDFGTGETAEDEAKTFRDFADDLLGKSTATMLESITKHIGDHLQTVKISRRDDDIRQIKFRDSKDAKQDSLADAFIDQLGAEHGGVKFRDGNVSDSGYEARQLHIEGDDYRIVDLGSHRVGGAERWEFETKEAAQDFHDAILEAFTEGDHREIINDAIEGIAYDLGGKQLRDGKVSTSYEARQIKLVGEDNNIVDLGSHRVGGKETYQFKDQATAQKFIDLVRDAVGVEAKAGRVVEEFIFTVTGAGIGRETFTGKDAFVEFLGTSIGGEDALARDGFVSESFDGASRESEDGLSVHLGPRGVGGKEIWTFETEAQADEFALALETYML